MDLVYGLRRVDVPRRHRMASRIPRPWIVPPLRSVHPPRMAGFRDHIPLPRLALRSDGGESTRCDRSEEHTSELQSHSDLVCRLLLEKKKIINTRITVSVTQFKQRHKKRRQSYSR